MQKGSGGAGPGGGRGKPASGRKGSRRGKKGKSAKKGVRPGRPGGRPGGQGRPGQNRSRGRPRAHCVCNSCGVKVPLYTDVPCYVMSCPKCGLTMVKEGAKPPSEGDQGPNIIP